MSPKKFILFLMLFSGVGFVVYLYSPAGSPELYNSNKEYFYLSDKNTNKITINNNGKKPVTIKSGQGDDIFSSISKVNVNRYKSTRISAPVQSPYPMSNASSPSIMSQPQDDQNAYAGGSSSLLSMSEGGRSSESQNLSGSLVSASLTTDQNNQQSVKQSAPNATNGLSGGADPGGDPSGNPLPLKDNIYMFLLFIIFYICRLNNLFRIKIKRLGCFALIL